jgi:hypothetical protein
LGHGVTIGDQSESLDVEPQSHSGPDVDAHRRTLPSCQERPERWDRALTEDLDDVVNTFIAAHVIIGKTPDH